MEKSVHVFRLGEDVLIVSGVKVEHLIVKSEEFFELGLLPNSIGSQEIVTIELSPVFAWVSFVLPLVLKSYPSGILAHSGYLKGSATWVVFSSLMILRFLIISLV